MLDKPQNIQDDANELKQKMNINSLEDDESLDELWEVSLNSPIMKKPQPLKDSVSGVLDWGELESAEIWDDIVNLPDGGYGTFDSVIGLSAAKATKFAEKAAESAKAVKNADEIATESSEKVVESEAESTESSEKVVESEAESTESSEKVVESEAESTESAVEVTESKDKQDAESETHKPESQAATPQKAPQAEQLGLSQLTSDDQDASSKESSPKEEENVFSNATVALNYDELEKFAESEEGNVISDESLDATRAIPQPVFEDGMFDAAENAEHSDASAAVNKEDVSNEESSNSTDNSLHLSESDSERTLVLTTEALNNAALMVDESHIREASPRPIKFSERMTASGVYEECSMTERARMGIVEPEGEVVTSEHELGNDFTYEEKDCVALVAPNHNAIKHLILIAAVCLISVVGVLLFISYKDSSGYSYPQQVGFNLTHNHFNHVYAASSNNIFGTSNLIGLCSDSRGILTSNRQLVADFWPGLQGCAGMRVSTDGSVIYYVDNNNSLYAVDFNNKKANGFTPVLLTTLQNLYGNEFYVFGSEVVYFARNDNQIVFRHHDIKTNEVKDDTLPPDALPCDGIFAKNRIFSYGYVSNNGLTLVNSKGTETINLEKHPKLGCSRLSAKACSLTESDNWSVLCNDSIHQGHGTNSYDTPVQYENTGIVSGADPFSLIRHAEGTELVTASEWVQVRGDKKNVIPLTNQRLSSPFEAIYTYDKQKPILGTIDGNYLRIDSKGTVSLNVPQQVLGAAFVGDGSRVVTFSQDGVPGESADNSSKTRIALWNVAEGRLLKTVEFPGEISAVNISNMGQYGFILSDKQHSLRWISWVDGKILGDIPVEQDIVDASWSDDDQYVLIQFVDDSHILYEFKGNDFVELRKYPSDENVAFAHDGLLWKINKDNQVVTERIVDGALSVGYDVIMNEVKNAQKNHFYTHPNSDLTVIWGEDGLWVYDIVKDEIQQVLNTSITWATADREGLRVATNAGIVNLSSIQVMTLPDSAGNNKLRWTGSGNYLQSNEGGILLSLKHNKSFQSFPNMLDIRVIGSNIGEHPSADLILNVRDMITTIELLNDIRHPLILSAFAGSSIEDWCWQLPDGNLQNQGKTFCKSYKDKDAQLPNNTPEVSEYWHKLLAELPVRQTYKHKEMSHIERATLSITTIPENVSLSFIASDGNTLPDSLQFEGGFTQSPFKMELDKGDDWIGVMASAEAYEARVFVFWPNTKNVNVRAPLLASGAVKTTSMSMYELSDDEQVELEIPDDLNFEFRTIAYQHYDELKQCTDPQNHILQFVMDNDQKLILSPEQSELQECVSPLLQDIAKRREKDKDVLKDLLELDGRIRIDLGIY